MNEDYKVLMKLSLINDISPQLTFISTQFKTLIKEGDSFILRMKALKTASYGLLGTAAVFAAPIVYAISKASELQKNMLGIQIATHSTTAQMEKLRIVIEKASLPTQFSTLEMSGVAKKIATSNSFTSPQLAALMPAIAKFVDVQALLKQTSPQDSAVNAVQLMHLAQKYSPKDVEPYFNELTKVSLMMPGGIGELRSAMSYSQPILKAAFGIDDTHNLMAIALLSRLGLKGSRGGTNLTALITRTIPGVFGSGLLKGKSHEALADMGFIDSHGHSKFMSHGKFDTDKMIMGLVSFVNSAFAKDPLHARERIAIDFQHAFGVQGGKVASLFSTPQARAQLASMMADFAQLPDTGQIQSTFVNKSVSQQFRTAMTNLQNIFIELGYNLLPITLRVLKDINAELAIFIPWMRAHKKEVTELAKGFILLGGALLISGAVGLLVAGLTALASPITIIVAGFAFMYKQIMNIVDAISYFTNGVDKGNEPFMKQVKDYYNNPNNQTHPLFKNADSSVVSYLKKAAHGETSFTSHSPLADLNHYINSAKNDKTIVVHHETKLNHRVIAESVTHYQANEASKQPAHGSNYNTKIGLAPNMLNSTGY